MAAGLSVRHDHGSGSIGGAFQDELNLLGIQSSPAFVRQPEANGCVEQFFGTFREQVLWIESFGTVEQPRLAFLEFKDWHTLTNVIMSATTSLVSAHN